MMNTNNALNALRATAHDYDSYLETENLDFDVIRVGLEMDELNWMMDEERVEFLSDLHNISYCRRPF